MAVKLMEMLMEMKIGIINEDYGTQGVIFLIYRKSFCRCHLQILNVRKFGTKSCRR